MIRALWTAASGMQAQTTNIDVISNNLANSNTTGFKKSRADFEDLMYQTVKTTGAPATNSTTTPTGIQIGLGVKPAAVTKIFSTGNIVQSGNQLDLAIQGDGFFQVQQTDGTTAYTRAGTLKKDGQGRLVTSEGQPILPEILIPSNALSVNIGSDGTVSVQQPGQNTSTTVGTLQLASFPNPSGLNAIGKNLFLPTDSSGNATTGTAGQNGLGTLEQGYVEQSNVSVVDEMVNMIVGQRAYEINSKAVQASDEMLQQAAQLKR
ncbi:flagellar basal-body rod protein FlgG [Geomonas sp. Red32]|uniref:flagellar basal-body rod protein FlgG n=1 Tax=Geomonas sp. Red32 TaxID=2912856 RepID=UPI00202CD004|nr:flagellar basal-body rod protein FlgG [Geomonas sp. Red32]MCM0081160.1 flagellar basal-body rod protein FlgG [Geomonas sp. Red32]